MGNACTTRALDVSPLTLGDARATLSLRENLVHERSSRVNDFYTRVRPLGAGSSGAVVLVRSKATGAEFACKTLFTQLLGHGDATVLAALRNEVACLRALDHPAIVRLHEVFLGPDGKLSLILEAVKGGELYERLSKSPAGHFPEADAARVILQIVSAVAYLHAEGIVHRDLKLENFLMVEAGTSLTLKLIDFGLSHRYAISGSSMTSVVGTAYYLAPEILLATPARGYDERCDEWSIGVVR